LSEALAETLRMATGCIWCNTSRVEVTLRALATMGVTAHKRLLRAMQGRATALVGESKIS
jgi:hypothetical protein